MGIFSVDTSEKLSGLCVAGLGIATCGTGVLPLGLAVAGAVLALPSVYKHFKGTDKKTYKSLINPPKTAIKEQLASWEKSQEYTKEQLSDFTKALDLLFGRLNLSPKTLMELGRDNNRIAVELLNNASLASPSNFALEIDGKANMELAQATINRDLLQKILITGLEAFETTADIEAKLQPFFQKELFDRMSTLQERVDTIDVTSNEIKNMLEINNALLAKILANQNQINETKKTSLLDEANLRIEQNNATDLTKASNELETAYSPVYDMQDESPAIPINDNIAEILALFESLGAPIKAKVAGISRKSILKMAQLIAIEITDPQLAVIELENAVHIAIELREKESHGSNISKFVDESLKRIASLTAESDYKQAKEISENAFIQWQERQQKEQAAGLRLLQTNLDLVQLIRDPTAAADTLLQIAKIEHPDAVTRFGYLRQILDEWYTRGRDMAVLLDLQIAEKFAWLIIDQATTKELKGIALDDHATSLVTLGERASGAESLGYLNDAVNGYDLALKIFQRTTSPAQWAMIQMNRATALRNLGQRASGEDGLKYLRRAVAGYDFVLEIHLRATVPVQWAMTKMNRAIALLNLGERTSGEEGVAYLRDAIAGYDHALEVYQRATMPVDWATTQMNRSNTLFILGERTAGEIGKSYLHDVVASYDLALEIYQRATMPADWAMTQMNRANALLTLGERASGEEGLGYLRDAVAGYDLALEVHLRATMPADWASAQMNRANALSTLGERASEEEGLGYLRDAVEGYDLALEVRQRATMPAQWATTQMNRAIALGNLGVKTGGKAGIGYVEQAIDGNDAALEVYSEPGMEYYAEGTRNNREFCLKILAEMKGGKS